MRTRSGWVRSRTSRASFGPSEFATQSGDSACKVSSVQTPATDRVVFGTIAAVDQASSSRLSGSSRPPGAGAGSTSGVTAGGGPVCGTARLE
jgi:hypothetical protein